MLAFIPFCIYGVWRSRFFTKHEITAQIESVKRVLGAMLSVVKLTMNDEKIKPHTLMLPSYICIERWVCAFGLSQRATINIHVVHWLAAVYVTKEESDDTNERTNKKFVEWTNCNSNKMPERAHHTSRRLVLICYKVNGSHRVYAVRLSVCVYVLFTWSLSAWARMYVCRCVELINYYTIIVGGIMCVML